MNTVDSSVGGCLAGGPVSFSVFEKIRHVCGHSLLEVVKRRAPDREESFKCCLNLLITGSLGGFIFCCNRNSQGVDWGDW